LQAQSLTGGPRIRIEEKPAKKFPSKM